jgi:hypothetical protein
VKKGNQPVTAEEIESRLEEMAQKLERLRGLYESFFMGVERQPPNVPRRELNRLILEMQQEHIGKATLRFRFQSMLQKWVLFTTYWNRTMREIESGTYRRDVSRAQRHMAERGGVITEEEAIAIGIPASRAKAFVDRMRRQAGAAGAATAAKAAAPPPRPAAIPGLADDVEAVYKRYLDTHRKANDPRPALTLEKITERLRAQVPRILAERNCAKVKLDIAVEDGKVRLKAWPVAE